MPLPYTDEALLASLINNVLGPKLDDIAVKLDTLISLKTTSNTNDSTYHSFWFGYGNLATEDTLEALLDLYRHVHARHEHRERFLHNASDLSIIPKGNVWGLDNPFGGWEGPDNYVAVGTLVNEFFNREDLDFESGHDNGTTIPVHNSIYGTAGGFQIDDSTTDFPTMLEAVHSHPNFENPAIVITYQQYIDTLGLNAF